MGSVSTKLLRKENPSQGSHFTFYFYCMSHALFSSAGFRGGSRRVPWGAQESKERTFFGPVAKAMYVGHEHWGYRIHSYDFMNTEPFQGHNPIREIAKGSVDVQ